MPFGEGSWSGLGSTLLFFWETLDMAKSILDDTDALIDDWLGIDNSWDGSEPRYKNKTSLKRLSNPSERPTNLDGKQFVKDLLARITDNWKGREPADRKPTRKNWRFDKQLESDPRSPSLEKTLEKSIVAVTGNDWANQVPVASGLVSSKEGHRAIDLVHLKANNAFEFIELKIDDGSGGPLFAAMELLLYGLIYVLSRDNMDELGYSSKDKILFAAKSVELQVLAPAAYYKDCKLTWLEETLSTGLSALSKDFDYDLSFKFRSFPEKFEWKLWSLDLLVALENIV